MQDEENTASTPYIHQSSHETRELIPSRTVPCQQKPFPALKSRLAGLRVSLTNLTGWRRVIAGASACTVLALLFNIALLIWACTKPKSDSNTFILSKGDCDKTKSITTWSHLGINIVSTLILSGSNYAIQILAAPTRDNADVAHRSGRSVTIGAPSFSNFKYIGNRRRLLYLCLVVTSIPFHTIYNSIIFDTTSAVDFGMFLVTNDFFDTPPTFNHSVGSPKDLDWIWKSASTWTNLTEEDCLTKLTAGYVDNYQNVVLVTNVSSALDHESWLATTTKSAQEGYWLCPSPEAVQSPSCVDSWEIKYQPYATSQQLQELDAEFHIYSNTTNTRTALVQYCLAQPVQPSCTVELSPQLLVVSIICNLVKIIALLVLLFTVFDPLVTIGDAVTSFLNDPDPITQDWGVVPGGYKYQYKRRWRNRQRKYFSAALLSQWLWTMLLCLTYLIIGIAMIPTIAVDNISGTQVWQYGLGRIVPSMTMNWDCGFIGTVLIVNLPQLFLSMVYLSYNSLLTRLLLSREWTNYAHCRKSLRVTNPEGQQRSTYFLSLPYTFSTPLLTSSAVLHWALSQSFYLVQVNYTYNNGQQDRIDSILTAGFSMIGLLIAVTLGTIMIIALISLGLRRYRSGIPLVRSDSRAISAACHSTRFTQKPESLQKLQYGVIASLEQDRCLIGLSSGPVYPLEDSKLYDCHPHSMVFTLEPTKIEQSRQQQYAFRRKVPELIRNNNQPDGMITIASIVGRPARSI